MSLASWSCSADKAEDNLGDDLTINELLNSDESVDEGSTVSSTSGSSERSVPNANNANSGASSDSISSPSKTPSKDVQKRKPRPAKTIKERYYDGEFGYIVNQKFSKEQMGDFYYKGFAYYGLARQNKNNPALSRKYLEKSKEVLKKVGINARNRELKARAILWYGILSNVFPSKKLNNYEKISPFAYIKTRLKDTKSYDDALFYAGLVYEKVGYYKSAKINYQLLDEIADNNFIYYYARRKVYPAKTISSFYLKNIDGKLSDLRKRKKKPTYPTEVSSAEPSETGLTTPVQKNAEDFPTENTEDLPTEDAEDFLAENAEDFSVELRDNDNLPSSPSESLDQRETLVEENFIGNPKDIDQYFENEESSGSGNDYYSPNDSNPADELDLSLDAFLKSVKPEQDEKNNQDIFILDDN